MKISRITDPNPTINFGKTVRLQDQKVVSVTSYPKRTEFYISPIEFDDLGGLYDALTALNQNEFISLSTASESINPKALNRRNGQTLSGQKTALFVWDIDDIPLSVEFDPHDPREGIFDALGQSSLPDNVSFIYQITSQQTPYSQNLRCRLYFLLSEEVERSFIKSWMTQSNLSGKLYDASVYHNAQPIYTASPVFVEGIDPIPVRWGVIEAEEDTLSVEWLKTTHKTPCFDAVKPLSNYTPKPLPAADLKANLAHSFHESLTRWVMLQVAESPRLGGWDAVKKDITPEFLADLEATASITVFEALAEGIFYRDTAYIERELADLKRSVYGAVERFRLTLEREQKTKDLPLRHPVSQNEPVDLKTGEHQLKQAVANFFKNPETTVLRCTVGLGKTSSTVQQIKQHVEQGGKVLYFVQNHKQAAELEQMLNAEKRIAKVIQPRLHNEKEERGLCNRKDELPLRELNKLAPNLFKQNCCIQNNKGTLFKCPLYDACEYYAQFKQELPVRIVKHAHLNLRGSEVFKDFEDAVKIVDRKSVV